MGKNIWRKILSGLSIASLLINSLLPFSLAGFVYAQESTASATLESPPPSPSPSPSPSVSPDPTATPSATPSPSISPPPTATPSASPVVTPSASPEVDATPELSTDSASVSREKIPFRKEGEFLKEIKKEQSKDYIEGEVIVKFKKEKLDVKKTFGRVQAYVFEKQHSLDKKDEIKELNIRVFKSKKSTEEMVKELKSDPKVEYAEPNYIRPWSSTIPDDTDFSLQWALNNTTTPTADVSAPEAWDIATGSDSVVVGVLDSGIAYNHPDLISNMWDDSFGCKDQNNLDISCPNHGWDFVTPDNDPVDDHGHGTHVAGIIGAEGNNSKGIAGMNWNVKLMALKIGDYRGAIVGDVAQAIDFAINNNVKVLNASFGWGVFSQTEYDAINRFKSAGGIFIAAAGNGGADGIGDNNENVHFYPSDYDLENIISVTATDQKDALASFSNYGATSVDVGAPGINIYSTVAGTEIFSEDFESSSLKVITAGNTTDHWEVGNDGYSKVAYSDKSLPYEANAYTWLESENSTDLSNSNIRGATLDFTIWCDTPSSATFDDYILTGHYSSGTWSISTPYDEDKIKYSGGLPWSDSGHDGYYKNYTENISDHLSSDFNFVFIWWTDSSIDNNLGCTIDDIKITKYSDGSEQYGYEQGTSMATPHVAGLAGLIWSYRPGLTYSQVKDAILSTGDPVTSLAGKTVSGKRINAHQALLSLKAPTITDISDDPTPTKSKTWNWDSTDATDKFRHLIDQAEGSEPSGVYSDVKTATQPSGDDTYYLHVQAKSVAGVESAVTTVSAVLDNTASVVNVTSPLSSAVVSGLSTVEFSNTEEVSPECSINNSDWVGCTSGVTTLTDITGFDGLAEGAFSLYVRDTDVAGNVGSDTEAGIIKDSTLPTGSITSPADGLTFSSNPVFTAAANDTNGVASVKFQYKASGAGSFIDMNTDASAPFEADWSGIGLVSNTTYDLQIIVEDAVGNLSTFAGVSFTYDVTAPGQPLITNPASTVTVNSANYSIEGTAEADSLVKIYSGSSVVGSQQLTGGATSFSIAVPLTQDATNSFEVSSTDGVGNESGKTIVSVITEDSTNPGIDSYTLDNPIISPQVSVGIKDTASIDLWFTEEVDYLISIKDGGGVAVRFWSGVGVTNPHAKVWDGKDTGGSYVADGTYTIEVAIADEASNSITDASKTIVVDNDPLTLDPVGDKTINENETLTFTATGSNDEGNPVGFSLTNAPAGAAIDSVTGTFSWMPTEAQGPGSYPLNVNAVSGDLFKSEEITITVNEVNTPPVANPQSISTNEDVAKIITLSSTDVDLPANPLTYSILSDPANGILSAVVGNQVTYIPNDDYNGADSFTFKVSDTGLPSATSFSSQLDIVKFGGNITPEQDFNLFKTLGLNSFMLTLASVPTDTAIISITVDPVNDVPTAVADTASVDEDAVLTVAKSILISNDSDIDGDPLTLISVFNPVNGIVVIVADDVVFTPTANYSGPASFDYTVSDGELTDTTTVAVTVNPVNDAPVANDGSASTAEDTPVTIDLSASDIDGDPLTYLIVDIPTNGSLGSVSGNQVDYTPNSNYTGPDSFTFKANDGTDDSSIATVSITVDPVNDAPVAIADTASVNEDITLTIAKATLLSNDLDIDGDSLTLISVSNPVNGTVSIDGDNVIFTPTTNYFGLASFDYTVTDGELTDTTTVSVTVNPVNDAPVANLQFISTNEDTSITINLSGSDVDGDSLDYSIINNLVNGTLSVVVNNQVTYTPNNNYVGSDSFTFSVNDGVVDSPVATVTITVNPVNDAPVAEGDTVSTDEDIAKTIILSAIDVDSPANVLTYSIVSIPSNGTLGTVVDNQVTYTPFSNYNGIDSFGFKVNDGNIDSNTATVIITVNPVNDVPVAEGDTVLATEDTPAEISLSGNDIEGDSLTYLIVDTPIHGNLGEVVDNQVTYTPDTNYLGPDSFTFKVNDGNIDSNTATIIITVNPVNDPPVLDAIGNKIVDELTNLTFTATATDPDSSVIYGLINAPTGATIDPNSGVFNWTPTETQGPGNYTLTVNVTDGIITDLEEITITVNEVNQAPLANPQFVSTDEDVSKLITLSASDVDFPTQDLTYSIIATPTHGTLETISSNQVIYIPNVNYHGFDSFTFSATDGTTNSNVATIALTIDPVNDPPVLDPIGNKIVDELTSLTFIATATDPDSPLSHSLTNAPAGATIDPITGVFSFTPTEAQGPGDYILTVNVTDGFSTDSEEITITVNEVNQAPVALDDSVTTNEDTLVTITLSATDADLPGQILTYPIVDAPANGVLGLVNVDQVTYTPNSNYAGPDSFTFKANDGVDEGNTATISITVDSVNDVPVAVADTASVDEDAVLTVAKADLISNDSDIDGDPLFLSFVSNPVNGLVVIDGDNVVFTPTANYSGPANFDYTVSDGSLTDTTTVSVTVNSVNDAPVADDGVASTVEDAQVTITLVANDVDGDPLTYSIVAAPTNGSLGAVTDNQVTYTPDGNYTGADAFTFKANDGIDDSNTATVNITVSELVISSESTNTPSETSVTITWTTNHPSSSRVIYDTVSHAVLGAAPNYGYANSTAETNISPKVIFHSVTINGLTAETTYYYRVVSHGSPEMVGDEKSLRTADKSSDDGGGDDDDGGGDTSVSSSDDSTTDFVDPYAQLLAGATGGFASEVLGEKTTEDIDQSSEDIRSEGADQEVDKEVLGVKKSGDTLKYLLGLGLFLGIVGLVLKKKQKGIFK